MAFKPYCNECSTWHTDHEGHPMELDIIERLMDFERCGLTPAERINLRECAAIEIHKLREEVRRLKSQPTVTDKLFETEETMRKANEA